jgi:hypothetical protein
LSPDEWKPILESIQVRLRHQGPLSFLAANKPLQQAFTPQEVKFFCEVLPRVFAEAQPSEFVVFGLTSARISGMADMTTGAWYAKGTTLYLVLSNYREGVSLPSIRELVWEKPLHMIAAPLYDFAPGPHQTINSSHTSLLSFVIPEPPQIALAFQPLATNSPASNEREGTGIRSSPSPTASLEERLRRLKQMHSEGLITDQEYITKKRSLLDGL